MTIAKIKKQKAQKSVSRKGKLSLKIIKDCLEATQLENKINHLEEIKIDIISIKTNIKN